uniref:SERPIN domain-containing protein n=1 Tax=Loa loa TaxID=7209 RepID=A0A1I7VEW5_LOALO
TRKEYSKHLEMHEKYNFTCPNVAKHSIPQGDFDTMKMCINLNLNVKFVTTPFLIKLHYSNTGDYNTELR